MILFSIGYVLSIFFGENTEGKIKFILKIRKIKKFICIFNQIEKTTNINLESLKNFPIFPTREIAGLI